MVALRSADHLLGFASMLVLARLLVPEDFGLVALGMAVIGSLVAFSEFGFDAALIQNQSAERRHYDTAWTLGLIRGLMLAGLLLLLAQPTAAAMGDERLVELISVLALVPLLEGLVNIGVVDFRKELVFSREFLYRFSSRVGGVLATLSLAYLWRDYWALVAGQLVTWSLRLLLSYVLHPFRPRLSLATWRDLFHFSKWILFNGIIVVISKRMPTFMIGAFVNVSSLGIFSLSIDVALLFARSFVAPIKRTFFPGYAKLTSDKPAFKAALLRAYSLVVLIAAPAAIGIGVTAELFVPLLFGEKWRDAVAIIEILSLLAFLGALEGQVRPALLAIGRPDVNVYLSIAQAVTLAPLLTLGVLTFGVAGAAWATIASRFIELITEYYVLERILRIRFIELWRQIWRSLVSCAILWLGASALKNSFAPQATETLAVLSYQIASVVAGGIVIYVLSTIVLWWLSRRPFDSPERTVIDFGKRYLLERWMIRTGNR